MIKSWATVLVMAALCGWWMEPAHAAEAVTLDRPGSPPLHGRLDLEAGSGAGTVVLVHGTLGYAGMELMAGLQERLQSRGLNSLAITLDLGEPQRSGLRSCDRPHRHSHGEAVDEIAAWVGWLQARSPGEPLYLLGHSRGGNQVARFLTNDKTAAKAIRRAVLVAPMAGLGDDPPVDALLIKAQALVAEGQGDTLLDVPAFLHCPLTQVSAASYVSYYGPDTKRDTPALLPAIRQPTLVVVAAKDTVVPDLASRLEGEHPARVRTVVIPEADHMFQDFAADDLADAVAEFLAHQPPSFGDERREGEG